MPGSFLLWVLVTSAGTARAFSPLLDFVVILGGFGECHLRTSGVRMRYVIRDGREMARLYVCTNDRSRFGRQQQKGLSALVLMKWTSC